MEAACGIYEVEVEDLFVSRRGKPNEPRSVAIYLMRRLRGIALKRLEENSTSLNTAL